MKTGEHTAICGSHEIKMRKGYLHRRTGVLYHKTNFALTAKICSASCLKVQAKENCWKSQKSWKDWDQNNSLSSFNDSDTFNFNLKLNFSIQPKVSVTLINQSEYKLKLHLFWLFESSLLIYRSLKPEILNIKSS